MIEQEGRVVSRSGEKVWVEAERHRSCSGCSAKGCGTSALARVVGQKRLRIEVSDPLGVAVGERVVVGVEEAGMLIGSLLIYLLPIVALILGAVVVEKLFAVGELAAVAGGVGGFLLSLWWIRLRQRDDRLSSLLRAEIIRRCGEG
ncbi:MAG: SoxR reducing system RseC family protein [Gammaproteobacteria bacterium]|nr:SoxR reducing system RseC family protein [Gammaproteobacteria bacterium]